MYDEYNIDPLFDPELEIAEPTGTCNLMPSPAV